MLAMLVTLSADPSLFPNVPEDICVGQAEDIRTVAADCLKCSIIALE
jgi:hypothetical protein